MKTFWGDSYIYENSRHVTADGTSKYDFRVLPEILSVNTNTGGNEGQRLIINGKGFNEDKTKVTVKVADLNCNVISSSLH